MSESEATSPDWVKFLGLDRPPMHGPIYPVMYHQQLDWLMVNVDNGVTVTQPVCPQFDLYLDGYEQDRVVGIKVMGFQEAYHRFRNEMKFSSCDPFLLKDFLEFLKLEGARPAQLDFIIKLVGDLGCDPVRLQQQSL